MISYSSHSTWFDSLLQLSLILALLLYYVSTVYCCWLQVTYASPEEEAETKAMMEMLNAREAAAKEELKLERELKKGEEIPAQVFTKEFVKTEDA